MNRIYQVIFNRTRGMYQVVSEIVKRSGKDKNSRSRNRELRLMVALSLCLMGIAGGASASYAAGPNENNPALESQIQEILEKLATQQNLIQAQGEQIKAHNTALGAYDQSLKNFEASVQANKDAITDITKDGGKLDQTIDQVNGMLAVTGQGMQRLQETQRTNSGAIKQLQTSVADITKQGGTLDKAIQNAVQKLTSTGGAVDTNKNAIAKNAGDIQANKTQIGKNKEQIGNNAKAIEDITKQGGTLDQAKQALSNEISSAKNELFGKIDTTKSALEGKIATDIGAAKSDLEGKIKKAQEEIGKTNEALEGRVSQNEKDIKQNKEDIKNLRQTVSDNKEAANTALQAAKKELNKTIGDNKTAAENALKEAKTELNKTITDTKDELSNKINTTKSALESKITTDIGTAKTDLEDKIKKAQEEIGKTNQALEGRVSQNEKDIKQNKDDIKNLRQTVSDNKEAADNALTTAKKELNKTIGDNKTAAENALKAAKTELNKTITDTKGDLQNKIDTTNETLKNTKNELSNKINTTKSDLEKVISDNKKDADTALTTVKNDLQGKINTTNQNLNQAKTDLTNKINKDVGDAKTALAGQISGVNQNLQRQINATNQTVATNQQKTDDNFKKIQDFIQKRIDGQAAGQKNLGLDIGENARLGFRYFRTSMDNKHDADPTGADSMAIGVSTTSGKGAIGIAAGGEEGRLTAGGENSIGIGNGVEIEEKKNDNTIAIGTKAKIREQSEGAIAIGNAANIVATNKYAIAIGAESQTYAEETMALGHSAKSYMTGSLAIGQDAQVGEFIDPPAMDGEMKIDGLGSGIDGIAIGHNAQSMSDATISIGNQAGLGMKKTGTIPLAASHVIIGNQAGNNLEGLENIAIGYKSGGNVQSNYNISIGSEAGRNIIGKREESMGKNVSIGYHANFRKAVTQPEQDEQDPVPGTEVDPTHPKEKKMKIPRIAEDSEAIRLVQSTAIGSESLAANNGTAVGYQAQALGNGSEAFGFNAVARGESSLALGTGSKAMAGNVAIGSGSIAEEQDVKDKHARYTNSTAEQKVVSVGSKGEHVLRRVTNVADAVDDNDAVTLGQLQAGIQQAINDINVKAQGDAFKSGIHYDPALIGGMPSITLQPGDEKTGTAIHNVAKGVHAGDAVNLAQLKEYTEKGMGHYFSTHSLTPKGNFANEGATGENSVAFGIAAVASAKNSAAMGNYVQAQGDGSLAIGTGYWNEGDKSQLEGTTEEVQPIMTQAFSNYRYNVAIGAGAQTEGNYSMAIGPRAMTRQKYQKEGVNNKGVDYALSMGYLATVYGENGIAIGHLAEAHQAEGIALGHESWSLRDKAIAIGNHNTALGRESGTMGTRNGVSGDNTYVIGNDNMNLADDDRKNVLDSIARPLELGITDENSTVLGNQNTMVSKFKTLKGLDGETEYQGIERGQDNHIVGNYNKLTRTNNSFVTGSTNELVETTSTFLVGSNNKLTNSNTLSGVLGATNTITGNNTTTLGNENKISGNSVKTLGEGNEVSGSNLAVIGNTNTEISGNGANVFGNENKQVAGEGSNVFGNANTGVTTENGHVIGFSNKAIAGTNQQVLGSFNATITGKKTHVIGFTNTNVSGEDQRVIGNENNNITGNRNTVLGNKNKEVTAAAEDTQLIGNENSSISAAQAQILGNSNTKISTKSGHVIGNTNSAIDGEKLSVIGDENSNVAGTQSLLFGYKNIQVEGVTVNAQIMGNANSKIAANRTQIIGNANEVRIIKNITEQGTEGQDIPKEVSEAVKDAQVMGNNNKVHNDYVQVLGNHITTTLDKSVYLGDNAAYNEDETLSATNKEYTKDSIYGYAFAGTNPVGVVTVGAKGKERRIQNVAAGLVAATSTDAVNGSQLYQLTRPLHFAGDDSTWGENDDHEKDKNVLHRGSNQNITIKGGADTTKLSDNNIGVTVNTQENVMNVKLAKNLTDLESITFGTDGTSMKIDGTNQSISQIKKVTFGAPDSQNSMIMDGDNKVIKGLSNTTWIPKDKRDATFDRSQAATQGQLEAFEKSTQRGFDVYVNKDEEANKFTVQLGDEKKNDAFGFLAGNNLTVSKDGKQITYALKDDLAVGKEGQDGKDGSLTVHGKDGETVAINGKDGNVTIESAKDGDSKKNTITMNGKDGTVGINGKDGATVVMNGDGTVVAKGKGEDGKPGASVTIDGKNGITTIEGKTDDNNQKNTITLNGKDGKMGVTGKDGSSVTLNGQDGSIGMNGKNGTNAVSITTQNGTVGVDGAAGTTRLVVKEGTKVHELATMNDGMKFMGDAGTEDKLKLNEQLTVTGGIADTTKLSQDNNIGVIADGQKKLTLRLAKNIQGLDTITLGDAEAPMKIDGTTKTISRIEKMVFGVADSTDSLIMDGKEKVITGLSNTTLPENMKTLKDDQAASQGQLKEVLSKIGKNIDDSADYRLVQDETATDKKYSVKGDGEVVLTVQDIKHPEKKDTVTIKDVAKKSDLDKADTKFEEYAVKYDKTPENKVNKNSITLEGDKKAGTIITNVGAGSVNETSKDAVNGSQLYKTNKGFDVYIKDNSDANKFNVGLGADNKDAFGFDAGNGLAITRNGKKIIYSLQDDVSVGKAGQDGKDGKVTVNGKDGESVTINGKNGEIGAQGPKGADGKSNSVTISGKDGTIGTNGKDGSSVVLNGKDGSIGMNGKDGKNAVSITTGDGKVGLDGKDGETRIIVKEGNHVNEVATMNDGLKFQGDDGTAVGVKLNNQVNIVGGVKAERTGNIVTNLTDNNIGVESVVDDQNNKNAKLVVRLAKNLSDLESITFDSKDKTTPMKIDGNAKTISNVNKITGLTNTTWPAKDKRGTDFDVSKAATQGQIQDVENAVDEKLKKSNQGFDILVGEDTEEHRANIALGKDKKETVEFAAGNSLDVTLDKDNKKVIYSLKDDIEVGKEGQPGQAGKDGKVTVNGKDGEKVTIDGKDGKIESKTKDGTTVTVNGKDGTVGAKGADGTSVVMNGKDGTIGAKGPKGADGEDGASVTINGKDGTTIITGATDKDGKKNTITLNGKDGTMGVDGKDGNGVTLNGQDGSIGIKGKDGTNKVQITTKDGKVGVDGNDGETRIVVKEGTKTHELATMNDGMQFAGDIGAENKLKLNQKLTVTGGITDNAKLSQDNNIGVIADGTSTLTLRLAKAIKGLDSITFGADDTAMKIDGATKTISNVSKITGLTNTTLPTDLKDLKADQAASQGQLRALAEKVQTNANAMSDYRLIGNEAETDKKYSVTDHNEIVLTVQDKKHPAKTETVTIKDVAKKSELDTANKKFTDYAVKYDKNGDTVNKNSITLEGGDAGTVIKNVANGKVTADSKEAINGSQLHEVKNNLTNEIKTTNQNVTNITNNLEKTNKGFDVYIKDKTADNTFNVGLGADDKDAFGFDAGNGLEISKNGKKITYALKDDIEVGKEGNDGKDGKITVNGKDGESITIKGKNGEIGIQGPKGDNGKSNSVTISGKDGTIGTTGKDGSSVVLNGKDGSIGIKGKDGKNKVDITTGDSKVGLDGTDGETRIIVKDGNKNNELATMNDGLKFKGDDGTAVGVKLNNQVNIVGGAKIVKKDETIINLTENNIGVESIVDETDGKNAKMKIRLAKNLSDLESITFNSKDKTNPMKINGDAKTIENIKKMTFGKDGSTDSVTVDGEQKVITGLSNTKLSTDLTKMKADQAASQGQLKQVLDKANDTDKFAVKYDKNTDGSVNKNSITLGGDTNGTVIKNVKAGDVSSTSKEAVNGSQLYKTNQGFDILVGQDTADNRANVALGQDKKETVEFAAGNSLEVTLDKNAKKVTYSLKDDIEVGKEGQPGQAGKDGKVTVNGKDGEKVTIDGKDGKIESKAKDGTTVTVNGKDGTIGAQGPKGADGKDGASVTINGKDGTTIINGATDENGKKNTITLNGKDGTMGVDGKDGNGVTLNGQDGSIGIKGKDGTNKVQITTKDGKVGVDGKDGDTRLVVKEGTKTHELATMNDGMQFDGDIGDENKLKLNQKLTVTGGITDNAKLSQDDNIGVIADGTSKLTLRLAKEIKGLDSITLGADDKAMKIDGATKTISNVSKITGLTNTTLPTDLKDLQDDQAASQGQLKLLADKVQTNANAMSDYRLIGNEAATDKKYSVTDHNEIVLTVQDKKHPDKTETVTIKDVAKKSELDTANKKFTDYAVKYDKNGDTVNKDSITLEGDTKTGTVIKNVGAGSVTATSKDAVNGSQLYKTNQGFDVYIKENTDTNKFDVQLGSDTKDAFGFDAGNGLAIARNGKKIIYSLQDDVSVGKAGQDGKDGKVTVNGKDGESVTIKGKNGEIGVQGPKGDDGKSNSVTISGKDGTIGTNGKDGSSVVLNGKDGSIGIKGKDGKNKVDITTGNGKVGLDGKDGETRIIVKEGNHVNEVATMNDGLKFKGDDGTAVGVKLNNQVNIVGGAKIVKDHETITNLTDNNIGVESIVDETDGNNAKMKIRLAKNLSDLESITFDSKDKTTPMKIDGNAKTIENIKKMTFGKDGSTDSVTVDGENKVITGLSNTKLPTDLTKMKADQAASQGQLKEVLDKATATDDFSVKYDKKDTGEVDKNSITLGGDTNGTVIKNVKAGDVSENSKEAVNGGQLYKTNQGFDILVGQDTADNRANVALGKNNKETVEFAAGNSLEVTLDKNAKKVTYSLKDDIEVGKEGQPGQAGKDGKVTVNGKDGEKVTIDGKDGKIESKAKDGTTVTVNGKDGTVGATGTDGTTVTMNGKDGTIGAKGADGTTVTVNGKDGTVGAKGTDGTSVTMNGKDGTIGGKGADGTTVTMNAKDGTIGAQGPKGTNGKDGASVTINGKDGVTTITGATDDKDHKNVIALDGKDGKMGVTGKDGNSVTLNGQDGSIDMKGKDGTNKVQITTKDGKVGVDGKDGDTRLVVKEGTKTHELATMNDGMQFAGDIGAENKLKLNQKLTVTGGITDNAKLSQDNNIGVIADGQKTLTLRLAKELKGLDSITFGAGDTAMKIDGTQKTIDNITKMTFKTTDNQDSIVVDGTNKVITGLSNTSLPTDLKDLKADQAASQGQLKQVLDKANDTDKFAVKYDKNTDGSVNKNSITLGGDTNGTVIKNVKAGDVSENSKDAVNGSQLHKTNQGFDVYIKENTDTNKFNVGLGADDKDAFGFDAGNGLEISKNGKKITYALKDDIEVGKKTENGTPGKDGKVTVNGKDGESVTINGKNGEIGVKGQPGDDGKANTVTISGKDGTIETKGKDGNSVILNGKDGSIGIKGKDGKNKVDITTGDSKVGLDGTDGETRIIVKDGNKNNELATMNDGLKFKGDDGNAIGVKLNKQVNIVGGATIIRKGQKITNLTDNNIGVESIADEADGTNAKMKIRLAKNLSDLESITFNSKDKTNPMVIDGAGRTIKDITTINFLKDGKNNSITGLSNVTWPAKDQRGTDFDVSKAATQGQIQDVENSVDEKLKKSNQGFDILVGEDTEDHRANIALGKDKKETVEFAAGNSLDVTLDKDNKKVIYSLKDDIEVGKEGQPGQAGKDGKVTVNGKDGEKVTIDGKDGKIESKAKDGTTVTVNGKDGTVGATGTDGTTVTMNGKDGTIGGKGADGTTVTMNAKDGTIGAKGPKGANGKDGASVTINGKDGITTITGATDDKDKKNVIALDGKEGKMGVTGKDGNSVTLNGQDGSIDMKGKDGKNAVNITTKDGTVGVDGQDGTTRIVVKDGDKTNELATMNDGMKFMGDFGTEDKLKLNEQLAVTGGITDKAKLSQDDNIGVEANGNKGLLLRLAKELKGLDGITFGVGDTAMKIDGTQKTINNITKMTFKTPDNKDSIVVDGTNKVITGLSNTTLPKDMTTIKADQAASQGQLKEVLDNAVKYDKKQDGTVDTSSITLEGGNDGTVIKNVKAGDVSSTSKEAVNGSQLYKTNQGFDILVGEDTEANRANVALGQEKKETVKFDAGKNLSASLDKASKKVSYRLNDEIELGEAKTADKPGVNGKITIHGTTGEKMTLDGKNGEVIVETTDENGKKNEIFLKSHDGTMGVTGKENNGVTLHGEGFVRIKGAGSDKAIDLTTEKGQVGVDGQGSSTRLLMKEGNIPHALATMDDGLKFMGDSGTTVGVKLNNQINIVGGVEAEKEGGVVKNLSDNNIGVESIVDDQNGKNAKMKIRLAKKLSDMESITFNSQDKTNPMTIDGVGRTIKDLTTMTFLKDGKNNFITGLSNVTWPAKDKRGTDFDVSKAATQGQIQDVENAVDEKLKKSNAGFDVYIKENTDENTFNIALGKDKKEAFGFLAGNGLEITRNGKEITYAMKDDIVMGKKNSEGKDDGKDGTFTVTGKAGNSVAVDGKDGKLTLASATDKNGKTNQIVVNGTDGTVRGDGKSGNAFEMNADAGTVGANGADGSAVVLNGKDGTIGMNGQDGKNKVTIGTQEGKVGIDGADGTTRVVVKEGDKVNELATMNDGLKFKGDSGDVVNRKLNETLSIEGGADTSKLSEKNIGVVTDAANGKMSVKLAKDLKDLTSVETKDDQGNTTNMTGAGVTTKDDKGNTTATTATGMTNTDAAGHVTNTTASGVVAKDKDKNETSLTATGTVVKDKDEHETSTTATGVVTKDKDGNQTTVSATSITTEDKDKNTNISTAKDITVADKDGNKTVINKDGITITPAGQNAISLTKDGLNNGGKTITGVATGVNDTDAVNVKQLKDEIEKNRTRLEGSDNIAVSGSGKADDPFKVSLKDDITMGKKNSEGKDDGKDGKFVVTGKAGNSVTVDGKDGQLTLASATDDKGKKNQIALNGKDGTVRGDGKSGNAFEMNADAGTVGAKGADGSAVVLNGKDGTIDMNGKDGKNKVTIGTQEGKVGIDGTNGTTRVVVKEGDKVNELATMNDGLKFKGDSGDVVNRKLNETLTIEGGADTSKLSEKNIGVVTDAAHGKMSVKLAKDLKDLTSVETKDDQGNTTNITGGSTTTTDNKGNTTTTNATGVTTTDGKGNKTTTTVDGVTTTDGKGNTTVINKGGITIQAKDKKAVSLTEKGLDNGGNKLSSIENGDISENSKDAVNGGQLYKTNQGFDILVGEDKAENRANVALGKDKKETVEFAAGNGLIATIDKDTKKITYAMKDNIEIGKKGEKDGKLVVNGKDGETITMNGKDGIVETKGTDGTTVTMNGKDGTVGAKGTDGTTVTMNGKDGTIGGKGADGTTVTMNAKDGTIGAKGPKGADDKDGASVTINGKDGTTTITGATDKDGKKNTISLDGKDGKMGIKGKDGNSVTLNGQDGSIGMKGKDGKNTVQITTKDGKVGVDGKAGETRIVVKDGDKVNELATMNDGLKFAGDSGDVVNRKLNETLSIEGGVKDATKLSDGNIGVVTDKANGKMTVKLAKELKNLERVETKVLKADTIETKSMVMGDVTLNETGLTIKNGPAVTKEGIDAGGKAIHHVAPGVIAPNSFDAINGAQLFRTEARVALMGVHIDRVGAGAAALAGLHPLDFDPDNKWDFAAAYGNYRGNNAFAMGAYYRPSEDSMVSFSGTIGNDNNMYNIGLSLKMGTGENNVTGSRIAMAREIIDLRKENKGLKDRIDVMERKMNQVLTKLDAPKEQLYTPEMYPDTPDNHWAYLYIRQLQKENFLGAFQSMANKTEFSRHEMAQMIYEALKKGAPSDDMMDRALSEFEKEIRGVRDARIRVDRLRNEVKEQSIDRVRVNTVYDTKQSQVNS